MGHLIKEVQNLIRKSCTPGNEPVCLSLCGDEVVLLPVMDYYALLQEVHTLKSAAEDHKQLVSSLQETLHLLSSPNNATRLLESVAAIKNRTETE
jgi:PHD/YefM family antitoxin component YafN of YafNO toxin-antitoxin module